MLISVSSANEFKGIMEVSHVDGNTTADRFKNEWYGCIDGIRDLFPEEWTICDVEDAMRKAGWQIKDIKVVEIEY